MKCLGAEELVRQASGLLSLEEEQALRAHLKCCPRCAGQLAELEKTQRGIAADPGEVDDPAFCAGVMARIAQQEARPAPAERRWLRWMARSSIPAFAAMAAALLLVVRSGPDAGFQARGGSADPLDQWVSLRVFRATPDGNQPVESSIRSEDALVFAYTNDPAHPFGHLMVLGVDGRGRVFWYYPAHLHEGENPVSIGAAPEAGIHPLPDRVSHALQPGPLRLFALFTSQPLDVRTVEAIVARALPAAGGIERLHRLDIDGAGQHSVLLDVEGTP